MFVCLLIYDHIGLAQLSKMQAINQDASSKYITTYLFISLSECHATIPAGQSLPRSFPMPNVVELCDQFMRFIEMHVIWLYYTVSLICYRGSF